MKKNQKIYAHKIVKISEQKKKLYVTLLWKERRKERDVEKTKREKDNYHHYNYL